MNLSPTLKAFAAAAIFGFLTPSADAADKPVTLTKKWTGSVADAALANNAPTCITTAKRFEKLWNDWKLAGKTPEIDFTKKIVVLATTPGSRIHLTCALSDAGDLKVLGMATADFGEGFRYLIATVSRDGVKTVEGKALPKE